MSKVKMTISIDEEISKLTKKQAIDENTNVSAIIEKLLTEYIKKDV